VADPDHLMQAALDGELDAEGWERLGDGLRRDPASRLRWWRLASERSALVQALSEDRGRRRHEQPIRLRRWAIAASLLLATGLAVWLAWPAPPPPVQPVPTPIVAGDDRLVPEAGASLSAVTDPLVRRWRLESGRLAAHITRDQAGRGFAIETPLMLVEVTGTRFTLEAAAAHSRLEVSEGAVLARAGSSEVMVPAGMWAERHATGWKLPPGLVARGVLWDAAAAIAGQAPLRRGQRTDLQGVRACVGTPGEETPNLRTIAIDLPAELDWRGDGDAVLEVRYHLAAAADPKQPPRIALQGWDHGPVRSLSAPLAADRSGQHRLRLAVAAMEDRGEPAEARIRSLIILARPEQGLVLLDARILKP
jgi:hypothetical protein